METIKPGYTRVSDILKAWENWDAIPQETLERKQKIGTEVHEAIHMHNCCLPVMVSPEAEPYFESFLKWKETTGAIITKSEERLYCDEVHITGCPDAIVKMPYEDLPMLVDWKTSSSFTKPMARIWALKGIFYLMLLKYNGVVSLNTRYIFVQLDPDGKRPHVREFFYSEKMLTSAIEALNTYRYFNPL